MMVMMMTHVYIWVQVCPWHASVDDSTTLGNWFSATIVSVYQMQATGLWWQVKINTFNLFQNPTLRHLSLCKERGRERLPKAPRKSFLTLCVTPIGQTCTWLWSSRISTDDTHLMEASVGFSHFNFFLLSLEGIPPCCKSSVTLSLLNLCVFLCLSYLLQ